MLQPEIRAPQTAKDIALGAELSRMQGRPIGLIEVTEALHAAHVKSVVIGTHATNGYSGRPGAAMDVDLIVKQIGRAARVLAAAFPNLRRIESEEFVRFADAKGEAID